MDDITQYELQISELTKTGARYEMIITIILIVAFIVSILLIVSSINIYRKNK